MKKVRKGISPVISTVIITASLLIILVIISYLAVDLLEIQVQSSEFEQAKTAMMILDKTIADVALRPGAASSVTFNQRSGGIGIYEGGTINIKVHSNSILVLNETINSSVIKYRGGRMATAAKVNLTEPGSLIVTDASKPLGYVRVEVGNGVWVVLDYNRLRVTVNRDLGMMDIYVIHLVPGTTWGSGTVTVRVQNILTDVKPPIEVNGPVEIYVEVDGQSERYSIEGSVLVIRLVVVTIMISIM